MAISVDWPTGVVSVPKADTTLTGTDPISGREIRSYDTDLFHEALRDEEETVAGRAWSITHTYDASSVLGGIVFAPKLEMVNSYQVEFENGSYRVVFTSTNNNISEFSVVNNVSIQPGNSAGLQLVSTGGGLFGTAQDQKLTEIHGELRAIEGGEHHSWFMRVLMSAIGGKLTGPDPGVAGTVLGRDMADTKNRISATVNTHGWRTTPPTLDGD